MEKMYIKTLLFELGKTQVFSVESAIPATFSPNNGIYWQDTVCKHTYGPFSSVYYCMVHYTTTIATQKKAEIGKEFKAPVIYVDFKSKSRVTYE